MSEEIGEFSVPCPRSLFEVVNGFLEFTKVIGELWVSIARRLYHVNFFMKGTLEKVIIDIQLSKRPIIGKSNRENSSNSNRFCDWAKSIKVIFPILLMKAFGN